MGEVLEYWRSKASWILEGLAASKSKGSIRMGNGHYVVPHFGLWVKRVFQSQFDAQQHHNKFKLYTWTQPRSMA